jgi:hypothetical protein
MKLAKKKRLTKLRVDSVDVVDRGAGEGVRIALIKRDGDPKRRGHAHFDDAYGLIRADGRSWRTKATRDAGDAAIEKARAEIEQNYAAPALKRQMEEEMEQVVDIAKAMENRIATMMKRDPTIRSTASAMLKLAESRDPADQELWRGYKTGTAPAGAVAKEDTEFSVKKALRRMSERVTELQTASPGLTRESAIAKVAASRAPGDRQIWDRYRKALGPMDQYVVDTSASSPRPSDIAFEALVTAIRASNPGMSDATARQWAKATQAHKPPAVQRLADYRL